jgi:4-hydroxyphenylpyruvate dioxygenase-like putative hemolysin
MHTNAATVCLSRSLVEVVQRSGSYDGYGAANASVRLAAQRVREARLYA